MLAPRSLWHALKLFVHDRKYFVARVQVIIDQPMRPTDPWLTREAISYLQNYLCHGMQRFEYGSGRSTVWFARRVSRLISIEDNPVWYGRVKPIIDPLNVDYRFVDTASGCAKYAGQLSEFPDGYFDFILIDGFCRDSCILASAPKVKPRGIIILDNSDEVRDLRPLSGFARHSTDNGIWQTDIFVRPTPPATGAPQQDAAP
jgi:hypothetical protein